MLQEYIAAMVGVRVGKYYQISNNFHVYTNILAKINLGLGAADFYIDQQTYKAKAIPIPLVDDPDSFDTDLRVFMLGKVAVLHSYRNSFFPNVAIPMFAAYAFWRDRRPEDAFLTLKRMPASCDWRIAGKAFFARRMVTEKSENGVTR
jgi:hypothetical protein